MSDNLNETTADGYAASIANFFKRYELAGRYAGGSTRAQEDFERLTEELDNWPLELVAQAGSPFEIVLTVGGPDVRIEWDARWGTRSAELVVRWSGSAPARRSSAAISEMAHYFADLMRPEDLY